MQPKEGVIVEIDSEIEQYKIQQVQFNNKQQELDHLSKKFHYELEHGKVVGHHQGAHYFTKGQRKGLAVGGTPEPLFVIDTDVTTNIIYTGQGKDHPGLYRKALFVANDEVHWVRKDLTLAVDNTMGVKARIRYRQELQDATLHQTENGLYITFENAQSAITEGQFVAWYLEEELIGSGVIS